MSTKAARERYLKDVEACILRDRNADYGDPEDNFRDIAAFWNIQFEKKLKVPFSPEDVAIAMDHVKNSRIKTSPDKLDHWIDKGGYAGCGYGIVAKAAEQPGPIGKASENPRSKAFKAGDRVWVDHPVYGRCRGTIDGFDEHNKAYCAVSLDATHGCSLVHEGSLSPLIDEAA